MGRGLPAFLLLASGAICGWANDIPASLLQPVSQVASGGSLYYWSTTNAGDSTQLIALLCRGCGGAGEDVPVVSVLRDSAGDSGSAESRLTYIWLLTYTPLTLRERVMGAVPFFYWHLGKGAGPQNAGKVKPLMNLAAPSPAVVQAVGRDVLQWTLLDGYGTPLRASSHAYRWNAMDDERSHLEEAIAYLAQAPRSDGYSVDENKSGLSDEELQTVIARLELRKRLLGELASDAEARRLGEDEGFEEERVRSRNWELLRQCAEKTGLQFEPLQLAGTSGEYALLSLPADGGSPRQGVALGPVWKLLNIGDPYQDRKLKDSRVSTPLALYSMNYARMPLLLVDFRTNRRVRQRELTQRYINEVTNGVIGVSHFANWYYFVAADLYDFVASRRGGAMDQAARLDCYSRFRIAIFLDHNLEPGLRAQLQARANAGTINPLERRPIREIELAQARYQALVRESEDGVVAQQIERDRRAEMAAFGRSHKSMLTAAVLHDVTFGLYTRRATAVDPARLDQERRVAADLAFVNRVADAGPRPEIVFDSAMIGATVKELASLSSRLKVASVSNASTAAISRLAKQTRDPLLDTECLSALRVLNGRAQDVPGPVLATALRAERGE